MLTSTRNRRVSAVARLHDPRHRRGTGLTVVEGPHQVDDVIAAGAHVEHIYVSVDEGDWDVDSRPELPVTRVTDPVLRRLAGTDHPRGPVAVVAEPAGAALTATDTVVLWDVADPGNVGAICRSAAAFGYAVAVTAGTADPWAPKVVRAAAGALFRTSLSRLADEPLPALSGAGLRLVATAPAGGVEPHTVRGRDPVALLIGNEARGLPAEAVAAATAVTIPLAAGVESLNAAVAASVAMYALRQR